MASDDGAALPTTLIGGYLGSGKTTLLKRALLEARSAPGSARYGVLVNDFGDINIDAEFLSRDGGNVRRLANGCACCAINDDLPAAIEQLRGVDGLTHVLVEASGVADTSRLAGMLRSWPGIRLGQIVNVVDVGRIRALVTDKYVGQHISGQLRWADHLYLAKTDKSGTDENKAVSDWLHSVSPAQQIKRDEPIDWLTTGVGMHEHLAPGFGLTASGHPHFMSCVFESDKPIERSALDAWLAAPCHQKLRIKGVLLIAGDADHCYYLNVVDGVVQLTREQRWGETRARNRIVVIGAPELDVSSPFESG